ncbi:GAF domain-containing protein [Paeniglutamicibacter sulfureus]|uniref:GAF domain-containing protein n=1 Tax=Paeniglutamicibacter sulfureus TaxID=43666 RepID=UPI00266648D2|nr:GAF domain-containing protein [Paeniglutamicibacter sulfureus]MDO2933633.1 GAF domain-containing protein [Paeniglutamicibacter sulfureus]
MAVHRLEAALAAFEDPAAKARSLMPLHRAWSNTEIIPAPVRPVVARSWQRQLLKNPAIRPLGTEDIVDRRERAAVLSGLVPLLEDRLLQLAADAGNELVISDDEGYVLWVAGPSPIRRRSEGIGFIAGARWRETDVGTNGLGAAMAERTAVQIFGPEHAREEQHTWVCTSAPIIEERTGQVLGAITLSGSYRTAHPHTLALVSATAREAAGLLSERHHRELHLLAASVPSPVGRHVLVDAQGWVAHSAGFGVGDRLRLPGALSPGGAWLPELGAVVAEEVPGGWLLHGVNRASDVRLELALAPVPVAVVVQDGQRTEIRLSERHGEILALLVANPAGLDAHGLMERLPGITTTVTVRAELSRLRTRLGGLIESRPYRLGLPAAFRP